MEKINGGILNLFQRPYQKGFTLIELLVVVLIIGILSAVALPQYQTAVAKSRLAAVIPTVKEMANALELYYMANGAYPGNTTQDLGFDLSLPEGCTGSGGGTYKADCPNGVIYDLMDYSTPTVLGANKNVKLGYVAWLDYSARPGVRQCIAATSSATANKVCKSMGGVITSGASTRYFSVVLGEPTTSYDLP